VRIGYACRDVATDRLTGSGAEVYSLACATAAAGHEVFLICAELAGYRREPRGPVHVPLAPPRPGYRYLTGSLEYADRVYDTVRALDLDVLEAVDTAGEAYTVVRAKRLLGEFGATHIVVAAHPWSRSPAGEPPASLAQAVDRHLEEYCRRHADEVVTGVGGALDAIGTPEQLRHVATLLPDEWLAASATGTAAQCAARVCDQFTAGADGVILHGATPEELAPVVDAYRAVRPAGVAGWPANPGAPR